MVLVFLENITSCACLVWAGLNNIFHWYAQSDIFNKLLLSTEVEAYEQLTMENKEVSSVKSLTSDISPCGK